MKQVLVISDRDLTDILGVILGTGDDGDAPALLEEYCEQRCFDVRNDSYMRLYLQPDYITPTVLDRHLPDLRSKLRVSTIGSGNELSYILIHFGW